MKEASMLVVDVVARPVTETFFTGDSGTLPYLEFLLTDNSGDVLFTNDLQPLTTNEA